MAANPKKLRIVGAEMQGPSTRVLEIECVEGDPFSVVGGKYVIVHTGLVLEGKAIKRAYSLMPSPRGRGRALVAIKRLGGPGSTALHGAEIGTELTFSGPWGKLVPDGGLGERTLLVATDTGITSALGIVEQCTELGGARPQKVLWLRAPDEDFLDPDQVRTRIEAVGVRFEQATIAPVHSTSRAADAFGLVTQSVRDVSATHVIASGDGAIVHPLREVLATGLPWAGDVRFECFFRNPEKKSA